MQARDNALSVLIERSIDLKSAVMTIDEKAQNYITQRSQKSKGQRMPSRKVNISDQVGDLEMQITKLMTDANSDQSVNEVRNHLIDLYTRIGVGLLKSH